MSGPMPSLCISLSVVQGSKTGAPAERLRGDPGSGPGEESLLGLVLWVKLALRNWVGGTLLSNYRIRLPPQN